MNPVHSRDVNEAKSLWDQGWGQLSRGRGQTCMIFSAKFYILTPFCPKTEIFGRFSTGLQKFRLKAGFNMETLLVNTPKTTSYTLRMHAGYCFCVYTLNRKCHILSVNVTKYLNSTLKTTRPRGQTGRGRGHNCHEAKASFWGLEAEVGTRT